MTLMSFATMSNWQNTSVFFKKFFYINFGGIEKFKFMTKDIEENEVSTQLKSELTRLAHCYIYKYTPRKYYLKKHKILQKLRSQKDIIITHPDKGNGIVILNRSDYIKSMTELISDKKKF